MNYNLEFHSEIENDYSDAYAWYENKKEGLGERFLQQVRKKIEQIAVRPQTFGSKGNNSYREAVVDTFPYVIVYKIDIRKKEIFVASIHHSKKHPKLKYR